MKKLAVIKKSYETSKGDLDVLIDRLCTRRFIDLDEVSDSQYAIRLAKIRIEVLGWVLGSDLAPDDTILVEAEEPTYLADPSE